MSTEPTLSWASGSKAATTLRRRLDAQTLSSYLSGRRGLQRMDRSCACNIRRDLIVVGMFQRKWTFHILRAMRQQPVRLSQLTRSIPGASKKALRAALRDLESAQIITRRDLSGLLLHVEYEYTDNMKEVTCALLDHLAEWSEAIASTENQVT
jgi:DNA-binding HxlR family transcriptional regulator